MTYYEGDIVEVLNADDDQRINCKVVVGQRYIVNWHKDKDLSILTSCPYGSAYMKECQVTLYKRTTKNKLKDLFRR